MIVVLKGLEGKLVRTKGVRDGVVTAVAMARVLRPLATVTADQVGQAAAVKSLSVQEGGTVAGMECVTVSITTLPSVSLVILATKALAVSSGVLMELLSDQTAVMFVNVMLVLRV